MGLLLKTALPSIVNLVTPLAKYVLIPLGLRAAASGTDGTIHKKKMLGSGFRTLIISNEEMNDIMKIIESLKESELLIKYVEGTITNEAKEQKKDLLVCS